MNRPRNDDFFVAEKSDAAMIKLLGAAKTVGSVAMSMSQVEALTKFYGTENHCRGETVEALAEAFGWRATASAASVDGLRIMAFLAKHGLLEDGIDPVTSMAHAIQQDLFRIMPPDIWNETDVNYCWVEEGTLINGIWSGDLDSAIEAGVKATGAERNKYGQYYYTAEETGGVYLLTEEDLSELGAALLSGHEMSDCYSIWCSNTGEEVVCGSCSESPLDGDYCSCHNQVD